MLWRHRQWIALGAMTPTVVALTLFVTGERIGLPEWDELINRPVLGSSRLRIMLALLFVTTQLMFIVGLGPLRVSPVSAPRRSRTSGWIGAIGVLVLCAAVAAGFSAIGMTRNPDSWTIYTMVGALMLVLGFAVASVTIHREPLVVPPGQRVCRAVAVTLFALCMALLGAGTLITVLERLGLDTARLNWEVMGPLELVAVVGVMWCAWLAAAILWMRAGKEPLLVRGLALGSWVSFAIVLPLHIAHASQTWIFTYASWVGLLICVPVTLWSIGPVIHVWLFRAEPRFALARPHEPEHSERHNHFPDK